MRRPISTFSCDIARAVSRSGDRFCAAGRSTPDSLLSKITAPPGPLEGGTLAERFVDRPLSALSGLQLDFAVVGVADLLAGDASNLPFSFDFTHPAFDLPPAGMRRGEVGSRLYP